LPINIFLLLNILLLKRQMKNLLILFLLFVPVIINAQDIDVTVGDSIELLEPAYKTNYKNIDYLVKTRWVDTSTAWQWETGVDFYQYFFSKGDFDGKRCPTTFKGTIARISAIQHYDDTTGNTSGRTVFMCTPSWNKRAMFWVEIEAALEDNEVRVIHRKRR
jgi:hypothetical protein